ncbi:UNVERIFIED_CONTAM: hypothetical protein PYX00_008162 [Menopon gallinae]|uniref:Acetyltransferase component of pyruvate dehydrogenase complex n=1 Tax=Menopon gallinae TaxID=328185 RepID=A0AAW2HLQ1_9NEOP
MIRTSVFRSPLLKSALKKDVSGTKFVRCLTFVCRQNRKKLAYRNGELGATGFLASKNSPMYKFYSSYPEHIKVTLPALSPTMEYGTIVSWEKKEGDKLNEGDLLAEIETDKATMGYETPTEGYLAKILVPAGTKNVPIGKLVCIIVEEESFLGAFKDYVDTEPAKPAPAAAPKAPEPPSQPAPPLPPSPPPLPVQPPPKKSGDRVYASPLAKRLAAEKGISLEKIGKGSGIYGSITSQDLSRAPVTAGAAVSDTRLGDKYIDLPVSSVSTSVIQQFLISKQTVPHYYLSVDISLDKIKALRESFEAFLEKDNIRISMDNFVIKAAALACRKVPEANSSWKETFIRQYNAVNVSFSVHTDDGLLTPVIFDADLKGLATISLEVIDLSNKAKEGKLLPSECEGGTVAISNLSSFGVKNFSAIIIPPQVCVLSMGSIEEKIVEDKSTPNGFRISKIMPFTLSCDHRVLDGAVGARWLSAFRELMEHPSTMLL